PVCVCVRVWMGCEGWLGGWGWGGCRVCLCVDGGWCVCVCIAFNKLIPRAIRPLPCAQRQPS
ncbi:hypothetical protein T492DRAFT_954790, partial [Pavlovales sp. CCMP2436]